MTKEALIKYLASATNSNAIGRYMDACIAQFGWEETDKIIREAIGGR